MAGAWQAIRVAFALPAAVAMRPPAPQVYRQFLGGALARLHIFNQLTAMALRHVLRHPVRSLLTAVGIAFSVALVEVGLGTIDSIDAMIDAVYFRADRQDATLTFASPRPPEVVAAVENLPGVMAAEPYLVAPVRISNGHYSRQLTITGKPREHGPQSGSRSRASPRRLAGNRPRARRSGRRRFFTSLPATSSGSRCSMACAARSMCRLPK